jgi:hypothetical protein
MATKRPKRPTDIVQRGKLIGDLLTGQVEEADTDAGKDPAAVSLGRRGGLKGGQARAASLTPARRSEIAKTAAKARHKKN